MNRYSVSSLALTIVLLGASFAPWAATGHDGESDDALIQIIHAIEGGWERADGQPFRNHFLDCDGARHFESGGQNRGLDGLIRHHVEPQGDAFNNFDLTISNIDTHCEGDFASAPADVEIRAVLKRNGETIHRRGYPTFLFRRINDGWKVVHSHSSSRPVKDAG